jgi:hypothetical protein
MKIAFERSPFLEPVTDLLRELGRMDFFSHGLLIGSWPMLIYTDHFKLSYGLTTNDIDLAIESAVKVPIAGGETIPELMERLGYTAVHDYSGIETFIHGTFEVEFITHRRGGKSSASVVVPAWKVSAQPLPFINILFIRPFKVTIEDFSICIPSPEALMLHKLIIAQRRTGLQKEAKKEKDLQQCAVLSEIARIEEFQRIFEEYRLSKESRKAILTSCEDARISFPGGLP